MKTLNIGTLFLLTAAWLSSGTVISFAQNIPPTPTPASPPSWVDLAPTEPLAQYARYAKNVGSTDITAVFKWERMALHDTKNYPVYVTNGLTTGPFGFASSNNMPIAGFDSTTNLRGTDSSRSNQTFAKDLAVSVQNKVKLFKKASFSPDFEQEWQSVEGGTLRTSDDFCTVMAYLDVNAGSLKKTYPHPIKSSGTVSVNDLILLTGRIHFVTPKGSTTKPKPVTATFSFSLHTPTNTSQESITVQGCTNKSLAMKLPVIPTGGLADLRDWSVVEDTSPAAANRCK